MKTASASDGRVVPLRGGEQGRRGRCDTSGGDGGANHGPTDVTTIPATHSKLFFFALVVVVVLLLLLRCLRQRPEPGQSAANNTTANTR